MSNAHFQVPTPTNEPVLSYAPGTPERAALQAELARLAANPVDVPLVIGGKDVITGSTATMQAPHDHKLHLGTYQKAGAAEVRQAIDAALEARAAWAAMPWEQRASVFLRAAELLAGPWRARLNAATMLGQSKTAHQAEIDSACELIDFYRFNVHYMSQIMADQPRSSKGVWNRVEYRPLEGFVFAVTPFNFTSIAGNLPTAPAMVGNVVLWKPASSAVLSAYVIMRLLQEAGLPDGVINFIPGSGRQVGDPVLASPDLAGIHFTGSTGVFQGMWRAVGRDDDRAQILPAHRRRDGRQGFHLRPSQQPTSMRWWWPRCAAPSNTRGRNAPPPRGCTSLARSGPLSARSSSLKWPASPSATRPISPRSLAPSSTAAPSTTFAAISTPPGPIPTWTS